MNENAKKALLIVLGVLAVGALGYQVMNMVGGEKVEVVGTAPALPPGYKSEKDQALEQGGTGAAKPTADPQSEAARDAALAGG